MASIKSIINLYNNEAINCSVVNKPDNSFSNHCQITNTTYKAKSRSNLGNYHGKTNYKTSEVTIKQRHGNHKKSINLYKNRIGTEHLKEYWRNEKLKTKPEAQFYFLIYI